MVVYLKCSFRRTSASDGISAINQTNLALKGVIAIGAMAQICAAVGQNDEASSFQVRVHVNDTLESALAQ